MPINITFLINISSKSDFAKCSNFISKVFLHYEITKKETDQPYLDVACEDGWPVTMVMIGLGFNQQVVFDSIKFFLNHESIKTSALKSAKQWKRYLKEYFDEAAKTCHVLKNQEIKERLEKWLDNLSERGICDEGAKAKIQKRVISLLGKDYREYFDTHYLSVSGIVLQKSDIPYIY